MTAALCDICGNIVSTRKIKIVPVKFGERTERVHICAKCERRDRKAPEKYIRKHFEVSRGSKIIRDKIMKTSETGYIPPLGGVLDGLAKELKAIGKLLFQPKVPLKGEKVEERREKAIAKLVRSIDIVEKLAEKAKATSEERKADTSKARYYHLLGYLVQVLDSVLRSVSLDEIKQHVEETDKEIVKLKRAVAKAEAGAGTVKAEAGESSEPRAAAG